MLRESFYNVISDTQQDATSFKTTLVLNKDHAIFGGHFPSLPVVPGVCMMQMVKELLEDNLKKELRLKSAGNIKFLSLINPVENSTIEVAIKYTAFEDLSYVADGVIYVNDQPYFKIVKAIYN